MHNVFPLKLFSWPVKEPEPTIQITCPAVTLNVALLGAVIVNWQLEHCAVAKFIDAKIANNKNVNFFISNDFFIYLLFYVFDNRYLKYVYLLKIGGL